PSPVYRCLVLPPRPCAERMRTRTTRRALRLLLDQQTLRLAIDECLPAKCPCAVSIAERCDTLARSPKHLCSLLGLRHKLPDVASLSQLHVENQSRLFLRCR